MHLPSAGRALPSHYSGSTANHRLSVCLSRLISLFSFPSSTGDLSLSFSPTAPLPYLPAVGLNHFLLWHVLYLPCSAVNLPLFSLPPRPCHTRLSVRLSSLPPSCLLSFSQVLTLLIAHCVLLLIFCCCFVPPPSSCS